MPHTSTSEQLQHDRQKQVYTLGLSNGLKHLSKTKEVPTRNPDQKGSNLSVFRIYPLSRSEEKGTQTLPVENTGTTVTHQSVQCEIWSTNPLTFTKGNMTEGSITHEIRDSKTGTLMKATRQDTNTEMHSGLPDITAGADCEENDLKSNILPDQDKNTKTRPGLSVVSCETNNDVKTSNYRVPSPPISDIQTNCLDKTIVKNDTVHPETTKDTERKTSKPIQPVAYPAENIIKATGSIANVSANSTMTDVQIGNPETAEETNSKRAQ